MGWLSSYPNNCKIRYTLLWMGVSLVGEPAGGVCANCFLASNLAPVKFERGWFSSEDGGESNCHLKQCYEWLGITIYPLNFRTSV